MDIVERLTAFKEFTGLTNSQFADKAGIPRPTLSQFLSGRNKRLSDDLTTKLHVAYPELNVMWLLFGEGDMVMNANIEISEAENCQNSRDISIDTPTTEPFSCFTGHDLEFCEQDANENSENEGVTITPIMPDMVAAGRPHTPEMERGGVTGAPNMPPTDPHKKIQSIMVFYSDNSYEVFTPTAEK